MHILEEIGLSKSEINIYERLLQIGECPVGILRKSLGIHPQIIYRAIESLSKKNLIFDFKKKNKRYVIAEHPSKLEEIQKEKTEKLKKFIPELLCMVKPPKDHFVKTTIGIEAIRSFRRLAINVLKRNDSLFIIGGSGDRFYSAMGSVYEEVESQRIKKKIHKKILAFDSEYEKFKKDKYKLYTEFRYFKFTNPTITSINIFSDNVGIIIWVQEPILIHIKNDNVAASYKHYFDELRSSSKIF